MRSVLGLWAMLGMAAWNAAAMGAATIVSVEAADASAPLTLEQISGLAQAQNPQLQSAAAVVEAARGEAVQAGLYPNPVVSGGTNQLGGKGSQYYALLSQEIVTKHKLKLDRAAATQAVFQAEFEFVRLRFDVLTAVRRDFYAMLAAQRRVEILKDLVNLLTQSRDTSERLRKGGEGTKADVLLLDVQLQQAEVSLLNAETMLAAARTKLAASAGNPMLRIEEVAGNLAQPVRFQEFDLAREWLVQENASARSAMVEIDRREILLKRATVEPYPNFTIQSGYQYNVEEPNNYGIVQLEVPLPVWDRNQGGIRAARANVAKAVQSLGAVQNQLVHEYAQAVGQFLSAQQQVEKYENQILPASREAIRLAQQGYQQGEFDFLRLLQAQQTRVRSELDYVNALENKWLAAADIAGMLQIEHFPPQEEETVVTEK